MTFKTGGSNAGLEPVVFAAMVPNSADKPILELMEEIMGDHELLVSESQKCCTTKVTMVLNLDTHTTIKHFFSMQTGKGSS